MDRVDNWSPFAMKLLIDAKRRKWRCRRKVPSIYRARLAQESAPMHAVVPCSSANKYAYIRVHRQTSDTHTPTLVHIQAVYSLSVGPKRLKKSHGAQRLSDNERALCLNARDRTEEARAFHEILNAPFNRALARLKEFASPFSISALSEFHRAGARIGLPNFRSSVPHRAAPRTRYSSQVEISTAHPEMRPQTAEDREGFSTLERSRLPAGSSWFVDIGKGRRAVPLDEFREHNRRAESLVVAPVRSALTRTAAGVPLQVRKKLLQSERKKGGRKEGREKRRKRERNVATYADVDEEGRQRVAEERIGRGGCRSSPFGVFSSRSSSPRSNREERRNRGPKRGAQDGHVSRTGHLPLKRTHCYVPIISFTLAANHIPSFHALRLPSPSVQGTSKTSSCPSPL